jgi:hypothetical protein
MILCESWGHECFREMCEHYGCQSHLTPLEKAAQKIADIIEDVGPVESHLRGAVIELVEIAKAQGLLVMQGEPDA